ncbi:MAG TPA: hypothetical protein VF721_03890 [Pyrinomonadaceae bacterium]|jgi:hypothetical protein
MKLPNHDKAIIAREKIVDYLLSFVHKDGRSKAEFFTRFGFTVEHWEVLADALKFHAAEHEVIKTETSPFGMRYIIEGELSTPDRRNPSVRSVWFIENDSDAPHLATAYPLKGKSR